MKAIQPVHTLRISMELNELTIGQTQDLCRIPARYEQQTMTAFLRAICTPIKRPDNSLTVDDPIMWSVNERMNATIYYMAAMLEDGPDFAVGDGHLHDYLLAGADYVAEVPFEFEGESLIFSPLHGYQAEAIESLIVSGKYPSDYFSWNAGYMAACMRAADEAPIPYSHPTQYQEALAKRIDDLRKLPESRFPNLFNAFLGAATTAQHFVHAVVTQHGVVAVQVTEPNSDTGVPQLGTARFRPRSAISQGTLELMDCPGADEI